MQEKQKDLFESRFQKLRAENEGLKEKLASQKKDYQDNLISLSRSETLLNAMPVGLVVVQDEKIKKINTTILEYLGYKPEDLIEAGFINFIHQPDRNEAIKIHKAWVSGRMSQDQFDASLIAETGTPAFFNIRCKRIRFHNRTAFLLILTCLKERLALEKQNHEEKKTEALVTMTTGVKDHLGLLNETILQTLSEWRAGIRSGNKNPDELLEKLESASKKARDIIEELEIIAGIKKEKQPLTPFNLNEAVKRAIHSANRKARQLAESSRTAINVGSYLRSSLSIEGDFMQIQDAITSLTDNALEAMPDGGDVHVSTEDNNGDAHIYVQDSGIGIPEKFRDRIFDPFFTTKPGATGLGLSLACSIVKNHGGQIELENSDGEGTIFHLRFPLSGQKIASKPIRGRRRIADSQILIIQDSDIAREVFSHLLVQKGCRITKSNSAREGLGKIKKKFYDMIVVDETALNMDRNLFIESAGKLLPGIAIALMTEGDADPSPVQGLDLIIRKPMDVNMAVKRISEILMNRGR
jgi:PAS domain S-box-containing protein